MRVFFKTKRPTTLKRNIPFRFLLDIVDNSLLSIRHRKWPLIRILIIFIKRTQNTRMANGISVLCLIKYQSLRVLSYTIFEWALHVNGVSDTICYIKYTNIH